MTKKYNARVGHTFWFSVGIVVVCISVALWFMANSNRVFPWGLAAFIFPLALMAWIYFDTWYKIEGDTLVYRSGFLKGKIPIKTIRKIKTNTTMWTGTKPALSTNGMVINYGTFNKVYIAPEDEKGFLQDIKVLNPAIEVE
jgi:hypothetical protein